MKVCTDACLFGAYIARLLAEGGEEIAHILDMGMGSGLLALMLAQKLPSSRLDGLELNPEAHAQAMENFNRSPWKDRLRAVQGDARTWMGEKPYDFIICNPPFYENDLKSGQQGRDQAMHASALNHVELLCALKRLLTRDGRFALLLPPAPFERFRRMAAEAAFFPQRLLKVRHSAGGPVFRSIGLFGRNPMDSGPEELLIYAFGQTYSSGFTELLKDYYLYL